MCLSPGLRTIGTNVFTEYYKISFLEVGPDNIVVSTLKKAERSKALVLRIYNTTGKQTLASIRAYKPIKSIKPANLNEEIK